MPIFEFLCAKCGHVFERFQNISDPPVKRCPECRCKVRKLLSAGAGILFKGSGFYETDYRSESYKKAAKAEKEAAKSTSSTSKSDASKKSDSKKSGQAGSKKKGKS